MLATLIDAPFDDKDWIFETKWDGFRLVAKTGGRNGTLYSRNGNDVTRRYASVAEALDVIKRNAVIDGELVALDAGGAIAIPAAAECPERQSASPLLRVRSALPRWPRLAPQVIA
jgi:ATP-dependent DNA ligase